MSAAKTQKLRAKGQWLRAALPQAHLSPPTLEELVPKRSLRRLHFRSYPGAAKLSPLRWATATQRLQAVLGFPPPAGFYCWLLVRRRRSPSDPSSISHTREVVVNRQNLYIRLITRAPVNYQPHYLSGSTSELQKPAQNKCPITRVDCKTSSKYMLPQNQRHQW